jgi:Uma2 family endonuclease
MVADPTADLRRRFTVEEYERMGQVGILGEDDRVELLDGEIVAMPPIGPKHASVVDVLTEQLYARLLGRVAIRVQNPVRLLPRSEPEPDVVVARRRRDAYRSSHPTAEDVLLVVEVADSSLVTDRAVKLPIYARQGIAEVWIVDLAADVVHVHRDPDDGAYRDTTTARAGDVLTLALLPDVALPVADLLGLS